MTEKILFVDDEANVLDAIKRQLRKEYTVSTALGGARGLKTIAEEGPFAVIISDMQMPEMNGIQFLRAAKQLAPDSVRLMLTGNADQKTAVNAVNEGNVFSFLTKPCPPIEMIRALTLAVEQYHLIKAERELLEGTLNGSVKLLMDLMSMVAPDIFGRTLAIRDAAKLMAKEMLIDDTWNLELASMLCNLASVTLPPETLNNLDTGKALTDEEKKMILRLPEASKNLISNIPRLEKVSEIVYYHQKHFNGAGFPQDDVAGDAIPVESRILKVLCDLEQLKAKGMDQDDAIAELTPQQEILYDPNIFKMAAVSLSAADYSQDSATALTVSLTGLRPGHVLITNVETVDGRLLFATGLKLTSTIIERLINYNCINKIKEPIKVFASSSDNELEKKVAV